MVTEPFESVSRFPAVCLNMVVSDSVMVAHLLNTGLKQRGFDSLPLTPY